MALSFTDSQKKISQALLQGPQSLDRLAEKTQLKQSELIEDLKTLQHLKLIALQGTPPVYALKDEIAAELKRRKSIEDEDDNIFRVRILIEVQGIQEDLVRKQGEKILENLKKEPFFRIYAYTMENVGEQYSTFAEINLSVRDFRGLVRLMFFYGPSSIEVIKPQKIEFKLDDFQNGLVDMTEMVHGYAEYIMGLLKRKQVEEFNTRIYNGAQKAHSVQAKATEAAAAPEDLPTI
ncbi:MAG: hypothetical protein AABX02_01840 [archaeon]